MRLLSPRRYNLLACIGYLLQYDEQIGLAALMTAANKGHHDCVSILVAHGVNFNAVVGVSSYSGVTGVSLQSFALALSYYELCLGS